MILDNDKLHNLLDIINKNTLIFIANNVGTNILSDTEKKLLKDIGINIALLENSHLYSAYQFGILSNYLQPKQLENLNYTDFKKYVKDNKNLPLTDVEKNAFLSIQRQAYKDINNLNNKIQSDFQQTVIDFEKENKQKFAKILEEEGKKTILNKETTKQLTSRLAKKTNDWKKDFGKIADFLMHTAFDEGRAIAIQHNYGDDTIVYKTVYEGACEHCKRLYLSEPNNINSEPKHFKVEELLSNGTNIGKKVKDWQPVVGSTHPFCRCLIHRFIDGYKWNEQSRIYNIPTGAKNKRNFKIGVKVNESEWKYQ